SHGVGGPDVAPGCSQVHGDGSEIGERCQVIGLVGGGHNDNVRQAEVRYDGPDVIVAPVVRGRIHDQYVPRGRVGNRGSFVSDLGGRQLIGVEAAATVDDLRPVVHGVVAPCSRISQLEGTGVGELLYGHELDLPVQARYADTVVVDRRQDS